ncbi:MAG: hypothetical protein HKP44_08935, partial [Desulfofustis sp.]|nr:hypothetical protein [Desulfofustis sp.]
ANVGTVDNAAAADQGSDVVRIPITGHGMTAGNSLTIIGSTNYDGNHVITNVPDVNNVDIIVNYTAETFAGTEVCYEGPGPDTNIFSDVTEISSGNGYVAGGLQLIKNSTDFPGLSENDSTDLASVQIRTLIWTASGGNLPSSGSGAAFLILTDDNGTQASREVWAWFDLGGERIVSDTQTLSASNGELRLRQPPQII